MTEGLPLLALDLAPGFSERRAGKPGHSGKVGAAAFAFANPCTRSISGGPFAPEPFPLLQGETAPPLDSHSKALKCVGTDEDQYSENINPCDACSRVLCYNPPMGPPEKRKRIQEMRQKNSYLGPNGHLERSSAWIHLIGATMFFFFATFRPIAGLDTVSTAGIFSGITSAVVMVTFLVSTAYHCLGTVGDMMPFLRMLDHGSIYIALACATVTDTAVVTIDFLDVPWQTVSDALFVAALLLFFFSYRRVVLPPSETVVAWGSCKLGLFRLQHADKDHSALRSSGYVILSFGFIALMPAAVTNLPRDMAIVIIACNGSSLVMLILGLLLDNVLVWPDVWYEQGRLPTIKCHSQECGCLLSSHAIWHLLSLFSVIVLTVGREIVIGNTLEGRFGSLSWKGGDAGWTLFE